MLRIRPNRYRALGWWIRRPRRGDRLKLLPGGMTVAWAKEKLAEPDAKEDAFAALVAEALGAE